MQHAGDALWQVWGMVGYMNKVGQPLLAAHLQQAATIIGQHINVPPPNNETLAQLSSALENLNAPDDDIGYAAEREEQTTQRGRNGGGQYKDPELLKAATTLVTQMVDSDQFEWAKLVASVHDQLDGDDAYITPKQCRALRNIADGRKYGEDEGSFWEWFYDEYPEAAKRVAEEADKVSK